MHTNSTNFNNIDSLDSLPETSESISISIAIIDVVRLLLSLATTDCSRPCEYSTVVGSHQGASAEKSSGHAVTGRRIASEARWCARSNGGQPRSDYNDLLIICLCAELRQGNMHAKNAAT